jgi:putative restriction endonuclease
MDNDIELNNIEGDFEEGKKYFVTHLCIERNPKVIKLAKDNFKNNNGKLYCEVCEFDFNNVYGERGFDFIEGHHKIPLAALNNSSNQRVNISDINMVCSNCHRMIHRKKQWITIEELKEIIKNSKFMC